MRCEDHMEMMSEEDKTKLIVKGKKTEHDFLVQGEIVRLENKTGNYKVTRIAKNKVTLKPVI